jgi:hypothetical protein
VDCAAMLAGEITSTRAYRRAFGDDDRVASAAANDLTAEPLPFPAVTVVLEQGPVLVTVDYLLAPGNAEEESDWDVEWLEDNVACDLSLSS